MRWWEDAQTKRTRICPWCGDDVNVLGWGVLTPQAMVQAMRPDAMVDTLCSQIIYSQEGFGGLVQFLRIIRRVQSHANKYPLNLYTKHAPNCLINGRIGQIPSLLKSGMLISHLRESTFVYHQVSICKPHLTWSFLCPLICPHISLNFIPVTHLFSRSHSFDSPACIVHFAKLTAEKMAFIYITWSFFAIPLSHLCFFPVRLSSS